ncbi:unnamed protein product [Adineta ricciae]|uniref:G-protein coupled receptors family 1 profile domain-containing protein n=1 Tax=Adineta ricciae TaxID=249248 RepID=A0A814YGF3_ADIRI|nr:unnamed protein product [Adineta ricciae]
MSDNNTIAYYVRLAASFNRFIPIPLLVFGTIGNLFSIIILTQKALRNNSCAFYFLSASIANMFCLWCGLLTRLLSGYSLDPTLSNIYVCKFRYFVTYMCLALSASFLVYASIDRWASSNTNVHIRAFSRISVAHRMIFSTVLFFCLLYCQAFYCYTIVTTRYPLNCFCPNTVCQMFNDILFLILFSIIPPILMITFGWLTVKNAQKIRQHANPVTVQSRHRYHLMRKRDRQMITMLLIQIIIFFICVTPSGISKGYTTFTFNRVKTSLDVTIENFYFQISALILYINCCCAFYIYTLTGTIFRQELQRLLYKLYLITIQTKRTLDTVSGSDFFKKSLDSLSGNDFFKRNDEKRTLDSLSGSDFFKKSLDSLTGNDFFKREEKRTLDSVSGSDFFKKSLDSVSGNDFFKKSLDSLNGNDFFKKSLDSVSGNDFFKRRINDQQYEHPHMSRDHYHIRFHQYKPANDNDK